MYKFYLIWMGWIQNCIQRNKMVYIFKNLVCPFLNSFGIGVFLFKWVESIH